VAACPKVNRDVAGCCVNDVCGKLLPLAGNASDCATALLNTIGLLLAPSVATFNLNSGGDTALEHADTG